jgi:hypothetical protein
MENPNREVVHSGDSARLDSLPDNAQARAKLTQEANTLMGSENWRLVQSALKKEKIDSLPMEVFAIATIRVEAGDPPSMVERGSKKYLTENYEKRKDLGNTHRGDGARYCGRGFIGLTGRENYHRYGDMLGLPLEKKPELAADPKCAAEIFAAYAQKNHVEEPLNQGNLEEARKRVNGGRNGLPLFKETVEKLSKEVGEKQVQVGDTAPHATEPVSKGNSEETHKEHSGFPLFHEAISGLSKAVHSGEKMVQHGEQIIANEVNHIVYPHTESERKYNNSQHQETE